MDIRPVRSTLELLKSSYSITRPVPMVKQYKSRHWAYQASIDASHAFLSNE